MNEESSRLPDLLLERYVLGELSDSERSRVAAAALVLVGFVAARAFLWIPDRDDMLRAKGGAPGLIVYKKAVGDPLPLVNGDFVKKGDILQLRYSGGNGGYGTIVSIDGRGSITWRLPRLRLRTR
jgi:hypothetical protein